MAVALLVAACGGEDAKTKPSASAAQPARPTAAPTPPPSASQAAAPKKAPRDCGKGPEITFEDPALEAAVRVQSKKPTGPITKADLAKVVTLNLTQSKQNDALDNCVFPHLTKAKEIFLAPGSLDDISMLADLKELTSLRLSITKIKDLTPLSGLKKLDRLDLGRTPVSDLKPLSGLTELTELLLDDTEVTDLSPLSGLKKLEVLSIKNTRISDLGPLKDLVELKSLDITGSLVKDTTAVTKLPKLKIRQSLQVWRGGRAPRSILGWLAGSRPVCVLGRRGRLRTRVSSEELTGLTRCRSNPVSRAARRSSAAPYPVSAIRKMSGCRHSVRTRLAIS